MGLKLSGAFRLMMNGQEISQALHASLVSIRCTEEAGLQADMLELVLADEPVLPLPEIGAGIDLALGEKGGRRWLGGFVCDEVGFGSYPRQVVIRARSAAFVDSVNGVSALQSRRSRSWPAGLSLKALVQTVASGHGLAHAVADEMADIVLPHLDQLDESDLAFLVRVMQAHDAVVRVSFHELSVFRAAHPHRDASGEARACRIRPEDVIRCEGWRAARDAEPVVLASWHSLAQARTNELRVGEGAVIRRLSGTYVSEAEARRAAEAEHARLRRSRAGLMLELPGNPMVTVASGLMLENFRPGLNGFWVVNRVEHDLVADGYRTRVSAVPAPD